MQPFSSFLSLTIFLLLVTTTHSDFNSSLQDLLSNVKANDQKGLVVNESLQQSISNQTHVSIALATHLLSKKHDSNIVFSPLAIHVSLSMLTASSFNQTQDQLIAFLKTNTSNDLRFLYSRLVSSIIADGSPNGGPRLSFVSRIWMGEALPVRCTFYRDLFLHYKVPFIKVIKAVEVAKELDLLAEKETSGLIKQVIPDDTINSLTRFIFANAIYFKGAWSQKFDLSKTKESDFLLINGDKVQTSFMTSNEDQFVNENDDFKVLGLPYLQGQDKRQFTMYIVLPNAKDGLKSLIENIDSTPDFFDRYIPRQKVEVGQFFIPKFRISFGFQASDILKELGLVLPFNYENGLTEIHHKSIVGVNEEGTEAASGAHMMDNSARKSHDKVDFVANHPFLFVIREDVSGIVLLMGQVIDPSVG